MSKADTKKKVVVTTASPRPAAQATISRTKTTSSAPAKNRELLFSNRNFYIMLAGIGFIALGLFLMSGGAMPTADVWDESIIYSKRRIVLAPLVIIIGLVVVLWGIFAGYNTRSEEPASAE